MHIACIGSSSNDLLACAGVECPIGEVCAAGVCVPDETEVQCESDLDCAAGWMCDGGVCRPEGGTDACALVSCAADEQCIEGFCVSGSPDHPCSTNDDCGDNEICDLGECISTVEPDSPLAAANAGVDFRNLFVADEYSLAAPVDTLITEELATDAQTEEQPELIESDTLAPAAHEESDPADACTCVWSSTPATAVAFTTTIQCITSMTPLEVGTFTLSVSVACPGAAELFTTDAIASIKPRSCVADDDCPTSERCTEEVCVPREGPVVTVLSERPHAPFVVTFDLRLEDQAGKPIYEGVNKEQFRIFENDEEIDYTETGYSITAAPNLPLKVVVVLDYTLSVSQAEAIGGMVEAARTFVSADLFTANHHLGVVEFHDRGELDAGFSVATSLTRADAEGKSLVSAQIPQQYTLEPGLSRVWDAVILALNMLGEGERQPGERHAIVFLTDGQDTSSEATAETILTTAAQNSVALYPIGFGQVVDAEELLRSLADQTRGTYFLAENADALINVFDEIALDLRGQWTLTYITQQNTGTVNSRVEFSWDDGTDEFSSDINVTSLAGDIHATSVEVGERTYDPETDQTTFLLRTSYVPRNISRYRFFVAQDGSSMTLQEEGGLAPPSGWVFIASNDRYDLIGAEPIEYSRFGNLGVVSVPGDVAQLQITHDDSVYDALAQPKTAVFSGEAYLAPAKLVVSVDPPAAGVVGLSPTKLAYMQGESVTLLATSFGDYVFEKWEGDATATTATTTVTMDGDKSVTAKFYPPRILTVTIEPTWAGVVTLSPNRSSYRQGETVVLTATPIGSTFAGWSGSAAGTDTSLILTMDGDKAIVAKFTVTP